MAKLSVSKIMSVVVVAVALSGISAVRAEMNSNAELPAGNWVLHYDWNCKGDVLEADTVLNSDHTYDIPKEAITGKWSYNAQTMAYQSVADKWPHATYSGTFDGKNTITGTMRVTSLPGCFTMVFGGL